MYKVTITYGDGGKLVLDNLSATDAKVIGDLQFEQLLKSAGGSNPSLTVKSVCVERN